jgi:ABC-type transporter Mla MlaB component
MLRITTNTTSNGTLQLVLAGRIGAEEVTLLESEIDQALLQSATLMLNLDGVQFIDVAGFDLIKQWDSKQVRLCGGSAFITMMLKREGLTGGISDMPRP